MFTQNAVLVFEAVNEDYARNLILKNKAERVTFDHNTRKMGVEVTVAVVRNIPVWRLPFILHEYGMKRRRDMDLDKAMPVYM